MSDNLVNPQQFYGMYLEFHEKLFETHLKCMQHLVAVLPFEKLNQIEIADRINQHLPILSGNNFIIEEKEFEYIFDQIFPTIKQYSYRQKEQFFRLAELNDKRKIALKELAIALITGEEQKFVAVSEKYDIPVVLLQRVTEFICAPYLELCAEFFTKKLSQFEWNQPVCPICGNRPSLAKVNEQAKTRWLWCRFCDTTWSFRESVCPFCLCQDLKSIQMIFPSDRKPFRIDACDNCKNYIKTIDELVDSDKYNLSVKNVETFYLDLLAKHHGYHLPNHFKFYLELV